jgi:hypothetical protein
MGLALALFALNDEYAVVSSKIAMSDGLLVSWAVIVVSCCLDRWKLQGDRALYGWSFKHFMLSVKRPVSRDGWRSQVVIFPDIADILRYFSSFRA